MGQLGPGPEPRLTNQSALVLDQVQPLTSLHPPGKEITNAVSTPVFSFKVHRMRGDKDQWLNYNLRFVQTGLYRMHLAFLKPTIGPFKASA
ncbi:hypothetical protein TNCV_4972651 [Trichonephila clavipes]|nr:hypothetical protein TNCV_4972651 [Trichonephila clavipes]